MKMKAIALLLVITVTLMVAEGRSRMGIVYPFPIDSLLKCRRPVGYTGKTEELPIPTIPIVPRGNDEVWLPEEIKFTPPRGTIDEPWLVPLLPVSSNRYRVSSCPPTTPVAAPMASGMIPVTVDTLNRSEIQLRGGAFDSDEQNVIRRFWDVVGFARCFEPEFVISRLPGYYYPKCFISGRCSGDSCSLPEGQNCLPSTRNTDLSTFFRWDCCWDYYRAVWRWACGWRLVNVQIIKQCYCACRPVLS